MGWFHEGFPCPITMVSMEDWKQKESTYRGGPVVGGGQGYHFLEPLAYRISELGLENLDCIGEFINNR